MPAAPTGPDRRPGADSIGRSDDVWYVSYGSNVSVDRFLTYLTGGPPPGSSVAERGARDPTPPVAIRAVTLPHKITFGMGGGRRWGPGGVAFVDPNAGSGTAWGAAYRITRHQFLDVVAQENNVASEAVEVDLPGTDEIRVLDPAISRGWYRAIVGCDEIDGLPALTFTNPEPVVGDAPAPLRYLRTIGLGLVTLGFGDAGVVATYLSAAPGVHRSTDEIEAALHGDARAT